MRRVWILAAAALPLAGCGGSSNSASSGSEGSKASGPSVQTISVSESEFKIAPSTFSVSRPGWYRFTVTNHGQIGHALEIEGQGVVANTGAIRPGSATTLKVDLSKTGSYEVYCPIDDHRGKGMKASLTVGPASAGGGMTSTSGTTTGQTTTSQKGGYGY